ncbi:Myrcene synthase protein [Thalictrum thalictroides]|uniref:Myrcene synthase protein n=1 Tax=Thalictrum thalictroides TaxID=46969 RepID=A0A7J6VLI9_THATH|nr:Myrcene synthase protein [Thalictrum thalictroides]
MALQLISFPLFRREKCLNPKLRLALNRGQSMIKIIRCIASDQNIGPMISCPAKFWENAYIKSFESAYTKDLHKIQAEELKANVRKLLEELVGPSAKLELIDAIERLGVAYHFEAEISGVLDNVISNVRQRLSENDLHTTALQFRLLRKHGYNIPEDIFEAFQDEMDNFKACLSEDVKGMLSLYEASHLGFEGEHIMDKAKDFTITHLKEPAKGNISPTLAIKVAHSLEFPMHWRVIREEARWYMDIYGSEENMRPALLALAKLDYNMVQATHQKELANIVTWWEDLELQSLSFLRDRVMINFVWCLAMAFEPRFARLREEISKLLILLTVLDDMYDTRGSLEELELFTDAVERWDMQAMELLPQYMKMCYMALLNANSLIGYEILKEQAYDITSHQKKAWVQLCKAYLIEAKWFHQGYMPTSEEYLDNAMHSVGAHMVLLNGYFLTGDKITKEALQCIESMPDLISCPAMMCRFANDLGIITDEQKKCSINLYMKELSISDEAAREHIRQLFTEIWKKMNKTNQTHHPFSTAFVNVAINLCRQAQSVLMFKRGNFDLDDLMSSVFEPISL